MRKAADLQQQLNRNSDIDADADADEERVPRKAFHDYFRGEICDRKHYYNLPSSCLYTYMYLLKPQRFDGRILLWIFAAMVAEDENERGCQAERGSMYQRRDCAMDCRRTTQSEWSTGG